MNSAPRHPQSGTESSKEMAGFESTGASFEETLKLLTSVSAPEGLEGRVRAALRAAPQSSRIFAWPMPSAARPQGGFAGNGWLRGSAAAAIMFLVAGGGWGVYRHAERPASKAMAAPVVQPAYGTGFSSAAAKRVPQTIKGPVIAQAPKQGFVTTPKRHKESATQAARLKPRGNAANTPAAPGGTSRH